MSNDNTNALAGASDVRATINGWQIATGFEDKEARIKDIELGERLKYGKPISIRVLIRSLIKNGKLSNVMFVIESITDTLGRTRKERVYYLTEVQATIVVTNAGTPTAAILTREIAEVFVAWRHGRLGAPTSADLSALAVRLDRLERLIARAFENPHTPAPATPLITSGIISEADHATLTDAIKRQACLEVMAGDWPERPFRRRQRQQAALLSARPPRTRTPVERAIAGIRNALGDVLRWGTKGKPWRMLPASLVSEAFAVIRAREVDVVRKLGGLRGVKLALAEHDGQLDLFERLVIANSKKRNGQDDN